MTSLNRKQQGFTIVELLIVIVVIGILAGLVITTFNGIQQKGRDTERQTDIKAIHNMIEAYYAQNGSYPALGDINNATWRGTNMKGLDAEALVDPKGDSADATPLGAAPTDTSYGYAALPDGCTSTTCTSYTLTANLEGQIDGQDTYSKTSLNN